MEHVYPFKSELFSPHDAEEELGLSYRYIALLCKKGKFIAQQVGDRWIITRPALDKYKKKLKNGHGNPDFGVKWKERPKKDDF